MPMTSTVGCRDAVTRWPVPEERRTVSVLFADIVGSTGLVERLDPEDVRALQRAYFGTVAGVLRRWHGVVEKYVGDAVMALFGVHGSDGFDAYRAVRAGLEIQDALARRAPAGVRLRVRVGVATGEVLVDLAGTRDGGHGAASGAVITAAARLQEYAPPGGVVVCAATQRATVGLLDLRPAAAMALAGRPAPLDVWRVAGLARPRRPRHRGRLVGRRRELATAGDEISRAVRDRRPRWVSLVGPGGSGRSRLLHELARAVSTVDGRPVRWYVAHCPPYPRGDLAPLADMVRAFAGLRDGDPPATVRRRLAGALHGLLAPHGRAEAVQALADLVTAQADTAAGRGAQAWREVLLALAAEQPVVVAVDDLDRAAAPLNRFLHLLFAAATRRSLPLAVVATHGPGWADLLPGAAGRRRRVPLPALGAVDTGRLLRHLLTRADRPAALANRLLPLVGGNPAVAGAYVAALDRDGVPAGVPEPVRRLVDVRLDRLDGEQRAALMAVAHHGATADAHLVARLLDWLAADAEPVLRALAGTGLLRRVPGGYAVAEPAVGRVARDRLPRALRAEFTRRLPDGPHPVPAGAEGGPVRPACHAEPGSCPGRAGTRATAAAGAAGGDRVRRARRAVRGRAGLAVAGRPGGPVPTEGAAPVRTAGSGRPGPGDRPRVGAAADGADGSAPVPDPGGPADRAGRRAGGAPAEATGAAHGLRPDGREPAGPGRAPAVPPVPGPTGPGAALRAVPATGPTGARQAVAPAGPRGARQAVAPVEPGEGRGAEAPVGVPVAAVGGRPPTVGPPAPDRQRRPARAARPGRPAARTRDTGGDPARAA
ncbi:adenylate/guanylate cyclase domain-containing protein [Micromonospora sp. NPDC050495]|uniref:adenylate/guanylate cyclase domain-containing protein n=1 Tax=Micromonospora sp. NPDC050495 TaxID=3154936 RepID=UPI0033FD87DA